MIHNPRKKQWNTVLQEWKTFYSLDISQDYIQKVFSIFEEEAVEMHYKYQIHGWKFCKPSSKEIEKYTLCYDWWKVWRIT